MATRYLITWWGSVTWDASNTAIWSDASGGSTWFSVPWPADDVIMDGSSWGGTVTLNYSPSVLSISMWSFTGTFTVWAFNPSMSTFNNSWTGTRTLNMWSGTWTISWSWTCYDESSVTNLTRNVQTSTVDFTYSGSAWRTNIWRWFNNVKISAGTWIFATTGSNVTYAWYLDFTWFSGTFTKWSGIPNIVWNFTLSPTMTVTDGTTSISFWWSGTQTLTTNGVRINLPMDKSGSGTLNLWSALDMTWANANALTITLGTFNTNNYNIKVHTFGSTNSNTRTLNFGSSTIELTGNNATIYNMSTSTNATVTYTTAVINCTYSGSTGTRTFSWGSVRQPKVKFSAWSDAVSYSTTGLNAWMDFTGYTWALTIGSTTVWWDFILWTWMTVVWGLNTFTIDGTWTNIINTNWVVCNKAFNLVWGATAVYNLMSNLDNTWASINGFTVWSWTFNTNNYNMKVAWFASNNANVRTINFWSSNIECTTNAGNPWDIWTTTNLTFNAWTSTILFSCALSADRTAALWGLTYNNVTFSHTGAFYLWCTWNNTFNIFTISPARIVRFGSGSNQTIATPRFLWTLWNVITIRATSAWSAYTLTKSWGGNVQMDYCNIIDTTGSTANVWYATNSTNGGGNTNITFTAAPSTNWNFIWFL